MQVFFGHSENPALLGHSVNPANVRPRTFRSDPNGYEIPTFGVSFKKVLRQTGRVTKKIVTTPSKIAVGVTQAALQPIVGKKIASGAGRVVKVTTNPFAAATTARAGTQAVIGKKAYKTASQATGRIVKKGAVKLAKTAVKTAVPGADFLPDATGQNWIDQALKKFKKKKLGPGVPDLPSTPDVTETTPEQKKSNLPLIIGGGVLAYLLLAQGSRNA